MVVFLLYYTVSYNDDDNKQSFLKLIPGSRARPNNQPVLSTGGRSGRPGRYRNHSAAVHRLAGVCVWRGGRSQAIVDGGGPREESGPTRTSTNLSRQVRA
jgi:hypothetical protein